MPSGRLTRALPLCGGVLASFLPTLLLAVMLAVVLGACTTQGRVPQSNPTSSANPASAGSASAGSESANPSRAGSATLDTGMTAVPEQPGCFVEKDLPPELRLQPGELWQSVAQERAVAQRFTRRGAEPCASMAKAPTDCERGAFPWALSQDHEAYAWSGARTVVAGIAAAHLTAGPDRSGGNVAIEYVVLRFDAGDPARSTTGALLAELVRRCGHARPGHLGGVAGLVATQPSFLGPGSPAARGVLVGTGDDLLWLLLDGGAWSSDSERHAVGIAVTRLRTG